MQRMFLRFFPEETKLAQDFASRLPEFELSLASLQGHFLRKSLTAAEAVDSTALLLQTTKPNMDQRKTIREHLQRVDLAEYASVFESYGISFASDLKECTLETLLSYSNNLVYDYSAQAVLKKLISSSESFLLSSYQLIDAQTARAAFLANYDEIGLSGSLVMGGGPLRKISSSELLSDCAEPPRTGLTYTISGEDAGAVSLDALSKKFVNYLMINGKGVISKYCMEKLFRDYPSRPYQCVKAAKAMVQFIVSCNRESNPRKGQSPPMTLRSFIKRAGLIAYTHKIEESYSSLDSLLETAGKSSSLIELSKKLKGECRIPSESSLELAEIIMKKHTWRGALQRFSLPERHRVMSCFKDFYTHRALTATVDDIINFDVGMLDNLAYEFVSAVCSHDYNTPCRVSVIEIENHLRKYELSPLDAIAAVEEKLLNPPLPPEEEPPKKREYTEWVYTFFIKEGGEEFEPYAKQFVSQGYVTKNDLLVGEIPSVEDLRSIFYVNKLGHCQKIRSFIEILRREEDHLDNL
jgi:hypothetical protein